MKKAFILCVFLLTSQLIFAQGEVGPEGHKLLWAFVVVIIIGGVIFYKSWDKGNKTKVKESLFQKRKIKIELGKNSLYFPDNLELKIKNAGASDVDLDQPLLVFDNFWLKRKFKLKGMGNRTFYPLYLEKNKTHTLQIDLTRFYSHDKSLKKFPKAKVSVFDMKGKRLGSKSVFLRKTLFKY